LKASFKVESNIGTNPRSGIAADYAMKNGTPSGNGFTLDASVIGDRELWVGLENSSGTRAQIGYGVTAMRMLAVQTSADGVNNMGNPINHVVGAFRREGVTVEQTFGGGFKASAMAFGNKQTTQAAKAQTAGGGAAGETLNGTGYTGALTYAQGPWNVGVAYDKVHAKNPAMDAGTVDWGTTFALPAAIAAADNTTKSTLVAGSYDFGVAKLFAQNYNVKIDQAAGSTAKGAGERNASSLGVRAPFGKLELRAQVFSGKDKVNPAANATTENRDWTGDTIGAVYSLSKRTTVYALTGMYKTAKGVDATANEAKYKQTSFGVAHAF
jgi:predicted porin